MHLTDHVADVQINEYLDDETAERAQIEAHLAECSECAARLSALRELFAEIESLPDVQLTRPIAVRFVTPPDRIPRLPLWLTLTASLQAVLALIVILLAAPYVMANLSPYLESFPVPSLIDVMVNLQMTISMWIESIQAIQLPAIPTGTIPLPPALSTEVLSITVIAIFLVWVIGNWYLLRTRSDSFV